MKLSEADSHRRSFPQSLQGRSIRGVKQVVGYDHAGHKAIRQAVMPGPLPAAVAAPVKRPAGTRRLWLRRRRLPEHGSRWPAHSFRLF